MSATPASPQPEPLRVAVIGLGYVGLPTAVGLAALGHEVIGVDTDCARIESLRAGRVWMHEPALEAALREVGSSIEFTTDQRAALETERALRDSCLHGGSRGRVLRNHGHDEPGRPISGSQSVI